MFAHAQTQKRTSHLLRIGVWVAITALIAVALLATTARGQSVLAATTIHQALPIASNSASYQGSADECRGAGLDPGETLWHFVLTQTASGVGMTLNVGFDNNPTQPYAATRKTGGTLHWYVYTSGGAHSLTAASTPANGGNLNLSHICSGGSTTSSSGGSDSSSGSDSTSGGSS